jgi:hypothetical protein
MNLALKPKKSGVGSRESANGNPASRLMEQRFRDLGDWREETLARMRALILEADPEMIEEQKWRKPSNAMAGSRSGLTTGSSAPGRSTRRS